MSEKEEKRRYYLEHKEHICERMKHHYDENRENILKRVNEQSKKGSGVYNTIIKYNRIGLRGKRNLIRATHRRFWRQFKKIIAPNSQLHHEWIPGTAQYRGIALVDAKEHQHGIINPIVILDGVITLSMEVQ